MVTARVLAHSSITIILSRVVPKVTSRTIPAFPNFSGDKSSNRGTMRPSVAMAINWASRCQKSHWSCKVTMMIYLDFGATDPSDSRKVVLHQ